jgi:hypothetical protein
MTATRLTLARDGAPEPLTLTETSGSWALARFDGMTDALAAAMGRLPAHNDTDENREKCHKTEKTARERVEWYGLADTSAVVEALANGYAPGVAMVEKMAKQLPADLTPPMGMRRRRKWSDSGDSVDMQRVWGGSVDRAWQRTAPTAVRSTKVVRLMVLTSAAWTVAAEVVAWRGVAALALTKVLTNKGYAVEIAGCMPAAEVYTTGPHPNLQIEVLLKRAEKPLDMVALCGPLTVMGFARHVGFLLKNHGPGRMCPAYGHTAPPESTPFWRDGYVAGFEECTNAATAAKFVRAVLAKLDAEALAA